MFNFGASLQILHIRHLPNIQLGNILSNSVHSSSHLLMTLHCAEILNFVGIYLQFFQLFSKLFVLFRISCLYTYLEVFSSSGFSSDFKVSDLKSRSMVNLIWIMFYKLRCGDFALLFYMEISVIGFLKTVLIIACFWHLYQK